MGQFVMSIWLIICTIRKIQAPTQCFDEETEAHKEEERLILIRTHHLWFWVDRVGSFPHAGPVVHITCYLPPHIALTWPSIHPPSTLHPFCNCKQCSEGSYIVCKAMPETCRCWSWWTLFNTDSTWFLSFESFKKLPWLRTIIIALFFCSM